MQEQKEAQLYEKIIDYGVPVLSINRLHPRYFGAVLPELLTHYGRSYSDGGLLVFLEFGGFLLGVLSMPAFSRRFSRRSTITMAFGLLLSMITIVMLPLGLWP